MFRQTCREAARYAAGGVAVRLGILMFLYLSLNPR
jgi:hypothetical protein